MCRIALQIKRTDRRVLAENSRPAEVSLVYLGEYQEGDRIVLSSSQAGTYLLIQLDDVMNPSFVYLSKSEFSFEIPFREKRASYNPKAFTGGIHLLKARLATDAEISMHKNLALNEYDCHGNDSCFPHAWANVETRGESVFAARNAIDGNNENRSHGVWPYESWGINQNPDAEFCLDFGRMVEIDTIVLYTRADFPHDNWWKQAELTFSDGTSLNIMMEKLDRPHIFPLAKKTISWMKLAKLIKDENDSSPFPALSQIQVFGNEITIHKE